MVKKIIFFLIAMQSDYNQALRQAGTINQLLTVKGAEHRGFSKAQKNKFMQLLKYS